MPNDQQQPNEQPRPDAQAPSENAPERTPAPNANENGAQPTTPPGSPAKPGSEPTPAPAPTPSSQASASPDDGDAETFPRAYVEDLRAENARYRTEAKTAEALAQRLHTELVRASGKLADPTDLPFDAAHLDDPDALAVSIERLTEAKPHLKARRIVGDIGQGGRDSADGGVNLLGMLRSRA